MFSEIVAVCGILSLAWLFYERARLRQRVTELARQARRLRTLSKREATDVPSAAWNAGRLRKLLESAFDDTQVCVIANREPYIHNRTARGTEVILPASGLVTALEPIVKACSGVWVGHGSGSADRETADAQGRLLVPPGAPEYRLRRVWLGREEEKGYYDGFANEGLWPLCHIAHTRPRFDLEDWRSYCAVNAKFANTFVEERLGDRPIVMIQDYHFAPLPRLVRQRCPRAVINLFWHIPWPNAETFGICPWRRELLDGMLGADLIGFHTQYHCNNFFDAVERYLEARVNRGNSSVTLRGHTCYVKPFPISVEFDDDGAPDDGGALRSELGLPETVRLGIGVDRVDYTKGLVERFRGIERFFVEHPEWLGRFCYIQIAAPSRVQIRRYAELNEEVVRVADEINRRFAGAAVPPILLRLAHHSPAEVRRYYGAAEIGIVTPLHDGMNLVAKEFVAAKRDLEGTLILSKFAGAAAELDQALIVNPYSETECAEAIHRALTLSPRERHRRMEALRAIVSERNVFAWAGGILTEIAALERKRGLHVDFGLRKSSARPSARLFRITRTKRHTIAGEKT